MIKKDKKLNFEEFGINRWTLFFNNKQTEAKYSKDYYDKTIKSFRLSFLIVTILYALFGLLDIFTSQAFISQFFTIRYLIVVPLLLLVWLLSFIPNFRKYWQVLTAFCYAVGGCGIALMLLYNPANIFYYGGMFIIFIAGYFLLKLYFLSGLISGIIILLFYNLAPLFFNFLPDYNFDYLIISNAFYIAANVIAVMALYNSQFIERREYHQRTLLSAQKEEIKHINESLEDKVKERTELLEKRNQVLNEEVVHRKKIEEKLIEAKLKAEESDRLKSAFLSNMSHEIRTPMNGIIGFLDLINDPDLSQPEQQEYLEIVNKSGNRLLQTINDIIEVSKIEAGEALVHTNNVNLNQTFQYISDFFSHAIKEKGLELIVPQLNHDFIIQTDGNKLESILTNLIKNAIKFTDEGSIQLGFSENKEELLFFVKDTGNGIPKDKFNVIFDRFVQADLQISRGHEGAGLGLSICKAYAENLGGKIWVESEEEKGTTFYFTITYQATINDTSNTVEIDNQTQETSKATHASVLVAEDDDVSFSLISMLLKKEKLEVIRALNGLEAIEYFEQNKQIISLIFMDIKMPIMDGLQAIREIRKNNKDIPIIAQTAFALSGDKEIALNAGCNNYISKPIKSQELIELLNQYLVRE